MEMYNNYISYKLETDFFGYTPNNFIHFSYLYLIKKQRWFYTL